MKHLGIGMVFGLLMFSPSAALAWCESDCVGNCRGTANKGYRGSAEQCIAQFNCSQYKGNKCEPERMKARIKQFNTQKGF